ncbi:DEAD/DEAH box helicase [Paractinoplanes globisporus]|uniref:DEAD/DEAH box helicase n=1 Tax=Paractinoplanes globisporus TaxID=113565 RepID=A0ABW6WUE3_9ACTN|nr:ATP-binding protein [Actinoplanes globisporus]
MHPSTVLAVLAELAPAGGDRVLDVTRGGQSLAWLDDTDRTRRRKEIDRLAALDALHREERLLRRGWGFLAGRTEVDGKARKIRVPLLSQPMRLERGLTGYRVVPAGDVEVTPLVTDRELAAALEAAPGLAAPGWLEAIGSKAWLRSAAAATGLPVDALVEDGKHIPAERVVLVARAALYVARDVFGGGLQDSLRSWAGRDLSGTALAAIYGDAPDDRPDRSPVLSPLPLTGAQAEVVARARTAPITVVSGPPGNGKSHTVVAAALEVVHRGGSVLVATQSPHAAEVLAALLARYPGPTPVLFGDAGRRESLAAELTAGAEQGVGERELRADLAAVRHSQDSVRRERAGIRSSLDREYAAARLPEWEPRLPALAADVPGAFALHFDPARLTRRGLAGWWARRRLRARRGVPEETVTDAIAAATAQRAAAHLAATGGTDLGPRWIALHAAEAALADAVGTAMRNAARGEKRWDREARRGASSLAAALRAGRNRRRELLAQLDAPPLVRALPLWIGTVADVEDLLPAAPGMFDLVVIDEASHVDQVRAAPVLARARRALIVGDPRQLRFVSFVSDVDVAEVLDRHGADERLDVRRVSTYDLAAGSAPATWLTEHHRSAPHLIGFSAHRFYADRIAVMTRTPSLEATDAIDVVTVPVATLAAEVDAVLKVVGDLVAEDRRGIGVISPFRAQAEALEAALVAAYPVERIEELGLRVGTVHAFQGSEAEVVVVSLGLLPGDPAGRRRFVTDPHLFNVMITRARRRLVVVTALDTADGLLGDYLDYASAARPASSNVSDLSGQWIEELAAELAHLEVVVRAGYRVGPWVVDLCVGTGEEPIGVLCGPHPDGADAHLDRQRALHLAGWRLVDAFASRWDADPRRAALEIAAAQRPVTAPAS